MEIVRYNLETRYCGAVVHDGTVYFGGKIAEDISQGIAVQTESILQQIEEGLVTVGSSKKKLLSVTIYLKDMAMYDDMNTVWDAWLEPGSAPARVCIEANMAHPGILVEMSVVAAL